MVGCFTAIADPGILDLESSPRRQPYSKLVNKEIHCSGRVFHWCSPVDGLDLEKLLVNMPMIFGVRARIKGPGAPKSS